MSRRSREAHALQRLLDNEFGVAFDVAYEEHRWHVGWTDGPSQAQVRQTCQQVWGTLTGWQHLPTTDLRYRRQLSLTAWAERLLLAAADDDLPADELALEVFSEDVTEQVTCPPLADEANLTASAHRLVDGAGSSPIAMWRTLRDTMNVTFTTGEIAVPPDELLAQLSTLPDQRLRLDQHEHHLVTQLRAAGVAWNRIGTALGHDSIQATRQRWRRLDRTHRPATAPLTAANASGPDALTGRL